MNSVLDRLKGEKVVSISLNLSETLEIMPKKSETVKSDSRIELYQQLQIGNFKLLIYNPFKLVGISSLEKLVNLEVTEIRENDDSVSIYFSSTVELLIDLREESFIGVEALVLYGPDNLCIVWN